MTGWKVAKMEWYICMPRVFWLPDCSGRKRTRSGGRRCKFKQESGAPFGDGPDWNLKVSLSGQGADRVKILGSQEIGRR